MRSSRFTVASALCASVLILALTGCSKSTPKATPVSEPTFASLGQQIYLTGANAEGDIARTLAPVADGVDVMPGSGCAECHGESGLGAINYVADMMETKFGIPWIKVNFIGAKSTAKSLRKIAEYFGDQKLIDRVEAVIAEEMPAVDAVRDEALPRTQGKTAMLFLGGSRAHHYQDLFADGHENDFSRV